MIIHDVVQGSREWWQLRLGMPTVSRFSSMITNSTLQPSKGRFGLIAALLVERRTGKPSDFTELDDSMVSGFDEHGTPWTRRGTDLEDEAARWYAAHKGVDVEKIGFVTNDEGTIGGSPDRKAGEGGLEIKVRSAVYHLRMVLGYDEIAERTQIQGSLWLTGWSHWDCLAYNPDLPKRIERHYPDRKFFGAFDKAWAVFRKDFERAEKMLDAIEMDVVEDDNLKALLTASLQKKTTNADALDIDDLEALRENMERAKSLGLFSEDDELGVIADINNDDWESVRGMHAYVKRLLETEATPV